MHDIFISYSTPDRDKARMLADALERERWSVWWDRKIAPGKAYDDVIEAALATAKCAIVLWSRTSVTSGWVKAEAAEANRRGILIPATLDDEIRIPLEFRLIQAAQLTDWQGQTDHMAFRELKAAIAEFVAPMAAADARVVPVNASVLSASVEAARDTEREPRELPEPVVNRIGTHQQQRESATHFLSAPAVAADTRTAAVDTSAPMVSVETSKDRFPESPRESDDPVDRIETYRQQPERATKVAPALVVAATVVAVLGLAVWLAQKDTTSDRSTAKESGPPKPLAVPTDQPVVTDSSAKLLWTGTDNGYVIGWNDANRYCRELTWNNLTGWSLPNASQLQGLFEGTVGDPKQNGRIRPPFKLSSTGVWTSERGPDNHAYLLYFHFGGLARLPIEGGQGRALCIRAQDH